MMPRAPVMATKASAGGMDSHEKDRFYREGLEAFNSGRFFEAHELWEDVWRETPEPDKRFLQGLIHVAAAFHHHSRANLLGTRRQLERGLRKLAGFPDVHRGLEIEPIRAAAREWVAAIVSEEIPKNMNPPKIRRAAGARHSL
jgi:predicted metal-dependent hydrolase